MRLGLGLLLTLGTCLILLRQPYISLSEWSQLISHIAALEPVLNSDHACLAADATRRQGQLAGLKQTCLFSAGKDLSPTGPVDGQEAELDAALARRVCPAYRLGDQPSVAFLHIPKTAGDEPQAQQFNRDAVWGILAALLESEASHTHCGSHFHTAGMHVLPVPLQACCW